MKRVMGVFLVALTLGMSCAASFPELFPHLTLAPATVVDILPEIELGIGSHRVLGDGCGDASRCYLVWDPIEAVPKIFSLRLQALGFKLTREESDVRDGVPQLMQVWHGEQKRIIAIFARFSTEYPDALFILLDVVDH